MAKYKPEIRTNKKDKIQIKKLAKIFGGIGIALVAVLVLFIVSSGFQNFIIGILAGLIEVFLLSNLFVANLIVIGVLLALIGLCIFLYRKI